MDEKDIIIQWIKTIMEKYKDTPDIRIDYKFKSRNDSDTHHIQISPLSLYESSDYIKEEYNFCNEHPDLNTLFTSKGSLVEIENPDMTFINGEIITYDKG